jgi:hypothetical protein
MHDYPILQLGNLNVDKRPSSYVYFDYSTFFLPEDGEPWRYVWNVYDEEEFIKDAKVYSRTLGTLLERLNLLGWSEDYAREFHEDRRSNREETLAFSRYSLPEIPPFDVLAAGLASLDLLSIDERTIYRGAESPWHIAAQHAAAEIEGARANSMHPDRIGEIAHEISNLDTATTLHMLARNPDNLSLPVKWWSYQEVIYEDIDEDEYDLDLGAKVEDKVLIVTEGNSDTTLIAKAISLYRPHLADFFQFVDMHENYPFTGVGNLTNFYKGLLKIGILNNVLIVFDNDTDGSTKYYEASKLQPLPNVRIIKLPDLPELSSFLTVGPTGEHLADINGRASSIECFLDLNWKTNREPYIRWTSYLRSNEEYQGELADKSQYLKLFQKLSRSEANEYDSTKISILLDRIVLEARAIATSRVRSE